MKYTRRNIALLSIIVIVKLSIVRMKGCFTGFNFNTFFEMDSVTSLAPTLRKNVYMIGKNEDGKTFMVLVDVKRTL